MRLAQLSLTLGFLFFAMTAANAVERPYDQASFDSALTEGRPVAVVFHADWCPTCRAQAPVLKQLMAEPDRKALTLFVADFDTELPLRKQLGVTRQSTIVVFNKGHEVARSTGDTQKEAIAALLSKANT